MTEYIDDDDISNALEQARESMQPKKEPQEDGAERERKQRIREYIKRIRNEQ